VSVDYKVEGGGPPIVYVCGLEGSGRLFYKQSEDLSRDHRVITMPLRPDGRYEMSRLVEDVAWVVRDADAVGATVLGESFGGLLTMATALAHPELFSRMILLNTFPHFSQRAKIRMGCALFAAFYPMMKAHRTRAARHVLFSPDIAEEDRKLFRDYTRVIGRDGYVSRMRIIRDTDLRPYLPEIKTPALVVAGTAARLLDSEKAARLMAARMPRARLKMLEGTGHVALLSGRVRVREWLGEFEEF
jgi:pimeloyl-ACP methyl ester carboxylesterase